MIVVKDKFDLPNGEDYVEIEKGDFNGNLYHERLFKEKLKENELQKLMCYFLPVEFTWINKLIDIKIQIYKRKLCHEVLKEASRYNKVF